MKKTFIAVALASSLMFSSCIGSFSLSKSLLSWNNQVGDKFVNELVFFAFWVVPVYEVSLFADLVVLNSIEFWSGNDPLAQGTSVIEGNDGRYIVECDGQGYTIKSETDGSVVRLDFDNDTKSWSYTTEDEESVVFLTFVDDNHVKLPADAEGNWTTVELNATGLQAYATQAKAARALMAAK